MCCCSYWHRLTRFIESTFCLCFLSCVIVWAKSEEWLTACKLWTCA
jgi:hypothetical protein